MEVDGAKEVGARFDEVDEGGQAPGVNGEAGFGEEGVVDEAGDIEGTGVVASHESVAEDEIHVVDGVDAAEEGAEFDEPIGLAFGGIARVGAGSADEPGDLLGLDFLKGGEMPVGGASNTAEQVAKLVFNDVGAERLVRDAELVEVLVVEEMSKGAVADIVQQGGEAGGRFDEGLGRAGAADHLEAVVPFVDDDAGEVHGAEDVLEAHVLGAGEDVPGGLELVDVSQALEPGVVDDLLFGDLAGRQSRGGYKGNVSVDGIVGEAFSCIVANHENAPNTRGKGELTSS